ncbi:MAG: LssY C-terminal domain-containing protein [Candidatus Andersenbacteria bacterium]
MLWVDQILTYVEHIGSWGYLVGFLAAVLEALAFVGFIVPGSIVVTILGFVASKGDINPALLTGICIIGAIIGDALSFYWGRNGTTLFSNTNKIFHTRHLESGKKFFTKHGNYSVFLGRFISGIRSFIPYIAGMFRMDVKQFFLWKIVSAILWSLAHVYTGYFFGSAWRVAEKWSARAGLFLFVAVISLVALWYLARFVARRAKSIARFTKSVSSSIIHAITSNDDVVAWAVKHPRTTLFFRKRTSLDSFWGFPFSLLCVAFLLTFLEFFGVVQSVATGAVLSGADVRVENLLYAFRSGPATTFFLWITMLGNWVVAAGALVSASILLFIWRKDRFIIPLWVAVVGSQVAGLIGKFELHRPRPSGVAIYTEQSFSFPSGHSIFAVALYGFLTYIVVRYARRWRSKIYLAFTGVTIIFLIGLSRLYVGVHYFSDVWGGYLLGLLWLIIGISLSEWISHKRKGKKVVVSRVQSHAFAIAGSVLTIIAFCAYFIFVSHDAIDDLLAAPPVFTASSVTAKSALDIFSDGAPQYTETLRGNRQEPISFIITAPSEKAFVSTFEKAGWYSAEQFSFKTAIQLVIVAITGKPYPTAPVTPSFWNQEVNDFSFEKPTPQDNIKSRHHARFWRTPYVTSNGDRVYVGVASLDLRIKWFVTHAISPSVDEERAVLLQDLVQSGSDVQYTAVQFVQPSLGKNFTGDAFFTDGKAMVVEIK